MCSFFADRLNLPIRSGCCIEYYTMYTVLPIVAIVLFREIYFCSMMCHRSPAHVHCEQKQYTLSEFETQPGTVMGPFARTRFKITKGACRLEPRVSIKQQKTKKKSLYLKQTH